MQCAYPVVVHETEAGGYWAEFVDFEAFTQGSTLDETLANAEEAMACHLEDELKSGIPLPVPSNIGDIRTEGTSFAAIVRANLRAPAAMPRRELAVV